MKIAFVFPGQGAQYAGVSRDVADKFPAAHAAFAEADRALDSPISKLCFEGPDEEFKQPKTRSPRF